MVYTSQSLLSVYIIYIIMIQHNIIYNKLLTIIIIYNNMIDDLR